MADQQNVTLDLGSVVEVVGESNYIPALLAVYDPRLGALDCVVELVPEPDNPYDAGAVRVQLAGQRVGYLSRDDARRYRPMIDGAIGTHGVAACRARVSGTDSPGVVLCGDNAPRMSRTAIVQALEAAGFVGAEGGNAGYGVQADRDRFKVMWVRGDQAGREESVPAMGKALRDAGYTTRIAREQGYPYVSVTGHANK